jgi:hypothetical protein
LIDENNEIGDRRRLMEAMFMERQPREAPPAPPLDTTRRQARRWMCTNAHDYETSTQLAEGANAALSFPPDALDDPDHWVWDEALEAMSALEGRQS